MTTWKEGAPPPMGFHVGPQGQEGYPQQGYPQQGYPYGGQGYPSAQDPPPPYPGNIPPTAPYPPAGVPYTTPPPQAMYGSSYSEDLGGGEGFDFSDKTIRHAFIRKVYGILMCQLLITFGLISVCVFHEPTKRYIQANSALFWVAFVITIVCIIAMSCFNSLRRKFPTNFIFLFVFTLAEAFMLGTACSHYGVMEILIAVGICAAVCLSLTLFAFQTKWDFTTMGGILLVCTVVFLIFGIVAIFIPGKIITLVYASIGAVLFSVYLVYDTQLMMGGKHKFSISPEEYIFAALNLYLDIVNIFLYLLTIIGAIRD